jgi:hypothetical protein
MWRLINILMAIINELIIKTFNSLASPLFQQLAFIRSAP